MRPIGPLSLVLALFAATPALSAGDPVKGRLVAEKWCALCHSLTGVETDPDRAPTFEQVANRDGRDRAYLTRIVHEDHFPMCSGGRPVRARPRTAFWNKPPGAPFTYKK